MYTTTQEISTQIMGSFSFKAISFLIFFLFSSALAQNTVCPFDYFFHVGDGVFDVGNAIAIQPNLPAARLPYGMTTFGRATGRWCDGLTDIDIGGAAMGFPEFTPYVGGNSTLRNAVIFAVARSPVLNRSFFKSRGIRIPAHAVSLSTQMKWFRTHLRTICSTPTACASTLQNSIFFTGDVEGNDVAFALMAGKSIREIRTYASLITQAQINAAREVIRMGASRVILVGNYPIGCFPYILTKFRKKSSPRDYDNLGCLRTINDLILYKNNDLQTAVANLTAEFPNVTIFYGDFYAAYMRFLNETISGPNGDVAMKSCCGGGGRYNYSEKRFCGSKRAKVCDDPSRYIHWDGIHLTESANYRIGAILQEGALEALNCTVST